MAAELAGKVAIITGGAKGIGAATVETFVAEDARVVIADVDVENGEALAARLGPSARFCRTNVADRADVQAVVDFAVAQFGGLDVIFNNAGITGKMYNRFLDDGLDDLNDVMAVNLAGMMWGSQFAAREMLKRGGGSIINTASTAAIGPSYALMAYRASKGAVITFSRSIAVDLGEYRIRVNCIAPGHIPTGLNSFNDPSLPPERGEALQKILDELTHIDQPLKRQGRPVDVANAALFLASDRSAQVTGQVIGVDGGVTAGNPINLNALLAKARADFLAS